MRKGRPLSSEEVSPAERKTQHSVHFNFPTSCALSAICRARGVGLSALVSSVIDEWVQTNYPHALPDTSKLIPELPSEVEENSMVA